VSASGACLVCGGPVDPDQPRYPAFARAGVAAHVGCCGACPTSRHDFTQAQLFALLALKTFFKTDYRGLAAIVRDWPELQRDLGLTKVPHFSALCYAEQRLLQKGGSASSSAGPSAAPACAA